MIYTIKKDATMFKKYNKDAKQLSSEKTANMVFRNIKTVNYLANIHIYAHKTKLSYFKYSWLQ